MTMNFPRRSVTRRYGLSEGKEPILNEFYEYLGNRYQIPQNYERRLSVRTIFVQSSVI